MPAVVKVDYASTASPSVESDLWRLTLPAIAIVSAFVIASVSIHLAGAAYFALHVPTNCGTGRHDAKTLLYGGIPLTFVVPASMWVAAQRLGFGTHVCRCSLWATIAAWAVSSACLARS